MMWMIGFLIGISDLHIFFYGTSAMPFGMPAEDICPGPGDTRYYVSQGTESAPTHGILGFPHICTPAVYQWKRQSLFQSPPLRITTATMMERAVLTSDEP
jgi:hypothetical protein